MAALLLGSTEMHQLINQAHFKLPGDGVEFPWHQDSSHRRYGRGQYSYVQTVLAVDEVPPNNGPLQLVPGSCKLSHLGLPRDGTLPPGLIDEREVVTATMQPGDVPETCADVDDLMRDIGFRPSTPIEDGIARFVEWYRCYHKVP